jgi:predicted transposase
MPLPITLSFKLSFERKEKMEQVIKLIRLQSSAICFIHNRMKEGKTDNEIYKLTQEKFNSLPAWNINSAIRKDRQYPTDEKTDGKNPERGRADVPFPILGRTPSRGLSPLKPILVKGVLDRVKNRLAPVGLAGARS